MPSVSTGLNVFPSICFICGSLEPGKNGVGDYTRSLARALRDLVGDVSIMATHDPGVEVLSTENQVVGQHSISMLRIPRVTGERERLSAMMAFAPQSPDTVFSIQYVSYSFHTKGLPYAFTQSLTALLKGRRCHIMFHEVWIGEYARRGALKTRGIGLLQRALVKRMIGRLNPVAMHTHLPEYLDRLLLLNCSVKPLPLFSNILPPPSQTSGEVGESGVRAFTIVLFSQIAFSQAIEDQLSEVGAWLSDQGRPGTLLLVGGGQTKRDQFAQAVRQKSPAFTVVDKGFCTSAEVSRWLLSADLALTPVPRHALGKSGTVASFLAHGLPILAPNKGHHSAGFFNKNKEKAILSNFSEQAYQRASRAVGNIAAKQLTSAYIARQMLADIPA